MGTHMKTTLDLADDLAHRAKALARRRRRTLRSVVEEALRLLLAREEGRARPFRLREASFGGSGLTPEAAAVDPSKLIEWSYGERS
jgi:hypothetical protein